MGGLRGWGGGWEVVDGTKTWVGVMRKRKSWKLGEKLRPDFFKKHRAKEVYRVNRFSK